MYTSWSDVDQESYEDWCKEQGLDHEMDDYRYEYTEAMAEARAEALADARREG